jgi:hypothetical protein
MIASAFDILEEFVVRTCTRDDVVEDLLLVISTLKRSLTEISAFLEVEHHLILIEKGILSGWRWTAFLDTLMNWAEMYCARQMVTGTGALDPVISLVAQGDDDQVTLRNMNSAAALWAAYDIMNFDVNPTKFFISRTRDEYLRQVIERFVVSGYPARGITSILWRNPASSDPPEGLLRADETLKAWNTLLGRGLDYDKCVTQLVRDIGAGNGLTKAETLILLSTPKTFGGLGFFDAAPYVEGGNVYVPALKLDKGQGTVVTDIIGELKGLTPTVTAFDAVTTVTDSQQRAAVVDMLTLPRAKVVVRSGSVTVVQRDFPLIYTQSAPYSGTTAFRWAKHWPKLLHDEVLHNLIDAGDYETIFNELCLPEDIPLVKRLHKQMSRNVFIDFLFGKLDPPVATLPGYSELHASVVSKTVASSQLGHIFLSTNVTRGKVDRCFLTIESLTREALAMEEIRLGG